MAQFKFNFPNPSELPEDTFEEEREDDIKETCVDLCVPVSEILPKIEEMHLKHAEEMASTITVGSFRIRHLTSTAVLKLMKSKEYNSTILLSEATNSDLIPGIYEGGFKIWECTLDLLQFLESQKCFVSKPKVLELGCGCAVPSLLAYLNGCSVTFQDYNAEVLEKLTIPNVFLNTSVRNQDNISRSCSFIAGHWRDIKSKYYDNNGQGKRYDVIITSETIYNKNNQRYLFELMKSALHSNGIIYLAAKTYYFGVGGTLNDFLSMVKDDGAFHTEEVYSVNDGVQRKIIMMQFIPEIRKNEK